MVLINRKHDKANYIGINSFVPRMEQSGAIMEQSFTVVFHENKP